MKINDFLKVAVLPRREHHFWRWGCDLDGLWNHPNRWKVVSERVKRERYKTTWKIRKFNEVCKTLTLTKCRIYHTDLMFSVFAHRYFYENMRSKSDAIWGPGLIFDRQKACQNYDFLAPCEIAFRIVKHMVLEGSGISETSKNDTEHRTQNHKKHSTQIHTKISKKTRCWDP